MGGLGSARMPSRTRPPARRFWSLASRFGASRPLRDDPAGFGALSASARTRLLAGTGEAAARMPGGAPMFRAGDRKAEDPETPPCEDGLGAASTATGSSPAEATAFKLARAFADPSLLKGGRDGVDLGLCSVSVKDYFQKS